MLDLDGESPGLSGSPSASAGGMGPAGPLVLQGRTVPILWGCGEDEAIIRADDFLRYFKDLRQVGEIEVGQVAICWHNFKLFEAMNSKTRSQPLPSWVLYREGEYPHVLECDGRRIWNVYLGVGASPAAMRLEVLIAAGVKYFIISGSAGGLCDNLSIGDFVIARDAIRDEGVSYHYLGPEAPTVPGSATVLAALQKACDHYSVTPLSGTTWTTDALFRETVPKVRKYKDEGVLTVEMEAAALYAVSQVRRVEAGCLFHVTDCIGDLVWAPGFHRNAVEESKEKAFDIVLEAARIIMNQLGEEQSQR